MKDFARLSPLVCHLLGLNPGPLTLDGTNTYLVGSGPRRALIDVGDGRPAYVDHLKTVLDSEGVTDITHILITHSHHEWGKVCDHSGGLLSVLELLSQRQSVQPVVLKYMDPDYDKHTHHAERYTSLRDGQELVVGGATLRAHSLPGHTPDSICIWLKEERALFTGDLVVGTGTAKFSNLGQLMASLDRIEMFAPLTLYTGKGPMIEGADASLDKIQQVKTRRLEREEQILALLRKLGSATAWELTRIIYESYNPAVWDIACDTISLHLLKLEGEGRLAKTTLGYALV
ncbi:Beta-lactamase-like protein 2 [Kappamyces sp. JEL0829]|nr:Beta-lactamase-like protein 2 [Kappamyces sp. JEL0829]